MQRIRAVLKKEFLHIIRDKRTLLLIVLMPLMQLILYGYAINTDVKHMAMAVYDEDQTSLSRRLINSLVASDYFDVRLHAKSQTEIKKGLDRGNIKAGLHIPPNFTKDLMAGRKAGLQLLIDGTDSNPANTALNTSQAIVGNFMEKERLIPARVTPIDYRPRLWYHPHFKTPFFILRGEERRVIIYYISTIIPLTHYLTIVRGVVLKGTGLIDLWPSILPLLLMAIFILWASIKKFHKRLE